jgi:hypothetical protein
MKKTDEMKTTMPFNENNDYIDNLWMRAAEKAIAQAEKPSAKTPILTLHQHVLTAVATAALVVLVTTISWKFICKQLSPDSSQQVAVASENPLDEFLGSISDEEAKQIDCYQITTISDYN